VLGSLPVWHALKWGQVSLPIYALVVGGMLVSPIAGGMGMGLGGAVKLYPLAFAGAPAFRKRIRPVAVALLTALVVGVLVPLAAFGPEHTASLFASTADLSADAIWALDPQWLPAVVARALSFLPFGVGVGGGLCLVGVLCVWTVRVLRAGVDRSTALALVMTSVVTGMVPTGWHHAFAFLPWVHALLLRRSLDDASARPWLVASIVCSWLPLVVVGIEPGAFELMSTLGLTSISATAAWVGLLVGAPRATDEPDPPLAAARRQRLVEVAIVAFSVLAAIRVLWLCDDAFVSFRYADNLRAGHGPVWNVGERVEGITNPLWTLWIAFGELVGWHAETWSTTWGVVAFGGTCALLVLASRRWRATTERSPGLPLAALAFALHPDAAIWATSGLEGSMMTFLLVAAFVTLSPALEGRRARLGLAGVLLGLAMDMRADAGLFAPVAGGVLAFAGARQGRGPWRDPLRLAIGAAAVFVPLSIARMAYYGAFFPNTFYAKSGDLTWWSQGLIYVGLYYQRYFVDLLGILCAPFVVRRLTVNRGAAALQLALSGGFVLVYTAYVARVGGDFMFARLLVPTAPFALWGTELVLDGLKPRIRQGLATLVLVLPLLLPPPVTLGHARHGVADEWSYYTDPGFELVWLQRGRVLRRYLGDLPVRVAFLGAYARTVRDARIPIAIESETGLTDSTIAHQRLTERTRPGHEKRADPNYLVHDRGVHFAVGSAAYETLGLEELVPPLRVTLPDRDGILADGETLWIVRWDPQIMHELVRRGAIVPNLPAIIDRIVADLDRMPDAEAQRFYDELSRVYFDHVDDPARQQAFERRLDGYSGSR
jgi:hypothetical protein